MWVYIDDSGDPGFNIGQGSSTHFVFAMVSFKREAEAEDARLGPGVGNGVRRRVEQPITGFHRDEEGHWVAELACDHFQHVRHSPPWVERPWVLTEAGRASMLGRRLPCKKCDAGEPADTR